MAYYDVKAIEKSWQVCVNMGCEILYLSKPKGGDDIGVINENNV